MKNKFYLKEFQFFDGENTVVFNILSVDGDKVTVAVTKCGKISVSDYVKECRAAMVRTGTEWEDTIERIGRWVEFKGAYKTMDNNYMESVWWAFKRLYEEGKIYEGEKILPSS